MNRLLVVEDEKVLNYVIVRSLEEAGFDVDTAYDGRSALNMTEQFFYDLIVLDVRLPKVTGLEVCRQLRGADMTSSTPILFLTGLADEEDRLVGFDMGCDDYVVKPFRAQELVGRVKAILKRCKTDGDSNRP